MATLLFYENVVPLNRDKHKALRLRPADGDCRFAQGTHYVPVAGSEFYQASHDYPILFSGAEDDMGPVALLGLRGGENLFIQADGKWQRGTYVPAFVRRYPFVLARDEASDSKDYTVCLDDSYQGFNAEEGNALFEGDGEDSKLLKEVVGFLQNFLVEMERTRDFTRLLQENNLLVRKDVQLAAPGGATYNLKDFRVVDEAALYKLDKETIQELHDKRFLGWIYAHLISLGGLQRLPHRAAESAP
ncbi:MAG: SapC family protein [Aquisalimonadaceae bacterium]